MTQVSRRAVLAGGLLLPLALSGAASAATTTPVRFGLNYTPSTVWWDLWQKFDAHRVRDDLAAIKSLGVDHIRIQLLWSVFAPTPAGADPKQLKNLEALLAIADSVKLDVNPAAMTSSVSGQIFIPTWAKKLNWVNDKSTVAAQVRYFRDLGKAVGKHPRLIGFDLGNELLGKAPEHISAKLRTWVNTLLHECELAAPGKIHTVSPNGTPLPPFPELVSQCGDLSVIHPWWFYPRGQNDVGLAHIALHHGEYNVEYIRSFHNYEKPRRKVWVQEVGSPRQSVAGAPVIPYELSADFLEGTVRNILSCEDVWGVTWWCSHDLDARHFPHRFGAQEYTLGLFDLAGKPKPIALRFKDIIAQAKAGLLPPVVPRTSAVVGHNEQLFDSVGLSGVTPAMVQPQLRGDLDYLASRKITTLLG